MHKIQSFFCLINLFDRIIIKKTSKKKDMIFFTGPYSKNVKKFNNSILNLLKVEGWPLADWSVVSLEP